MTYNQIHVRKRIGTYTKRLMLSIVCQSAQIRCRDRKIFLIIVLILRTKKETTVIGIIKNILNCLERCSIYHCVVIYMDDRVVGVTYL